MPPKVRDTILAAVKKAAKDGCPVAGDDARCARIAAIAIRRIESRARRGSKVSAQRDLCVGLVQQLEPEPGLVGPLLKDYDYLAGEILAAVGMKAE